MRGRNELAFVLVMKKVIATVMMQMSVRFQRSAVYSIFPASRNSPNSS